MSEEIGEQRSMGPQTADCKGTKSKAAWAKPKIERVPLVETREGGPNITDGPVTASS